MLTVDNKELIHNFIFILNNNKCLLITKYILLHLLIWEIQLDKPTTVWRFETWMLKDFK
jgi:hypothetical protein